MYKELPTGEEILKIAKSLFPFNYSVTGEDSFLAEQAFMGELSFSKHEFNSGEELRGWRLPNGWNAVEALIKYKGSIIYDCINKTPLGCAYLSPSFNATINKEKLIEHSSFREDLPDATVYDWTRLYRTGDLSWGLSIPWEILKGLPDDDLEISIITRTYSSKMIVYDYLLEGNSSEEIIINAHNCHPYQANDDISGCAVGIALIKYLKQIPNRRFSYRLLIAPELYGPMFWLEKNKHNINKIASTILLKSVGNSSTLKLLNSFNGDSYAEKAIKLSLKENCKSGLEQYPFRVHYGNDETVFESPGFEIPSPTLTRFPFLEYHTDLDNIAKLSKEALEETSMVLINSILILEENVMASTKINGLYCLSNPKYDLYLKHAEPGISKEGTSTNEKSWNLMMNCLPMLLAKGISTIDLCNRYSLSFFDVSQYLKSWESKGLAILENINRLK